MKKTLLVILSLFFTPLLQASNSATLQEAGFTQAEAEWLGASIDSQGKKIPPDEARACRNEIYGNKFMHDKITGWIENGFSYSDSLPWMDLDFRPEEAAAWEKSGYSPREAYDEIYRQDREKYAEREKLSEQLSKLGYDLSKEKDRKILAKSNPYSVAGEMFFLGDRVECFQLLDRNSGLYVIGYKNYFPILAFLKFGSNDAISKNTVFSCRAIGTGAFKYQSGAGLQIVPALKVVAVTDRETKATTLISSNAK